MPTEKKPEYSPGLAGVIAGETAICWVDPAAGLMYRGYDIHDMAQKASFEEVAYLLLNGELPNGKQLVEFTQQIAAERALPGAVIEMLRLLPSKTHPMDMLRTGVSMLSAFDKDLSDNSHDANIRKSIRLIARVSTLITDGWRISHGEQALPEKTDLTQAGNFFYKLEGKVPQDWQIRMLDTIFNLYADHEFNASTFAARVRDSGWCGKLADEKTGDEREDHGIRPSRLQRGRLTRAGDARDRAGLGQAYRKRKLGSNLRETRRSHGSRKTSLRQCGSLCGSGVLDARVPTGVKHASIRCVARGRLVRACD